jgi:hypothetical protein
MYFYSRQDNTNKFANGPQHDLTNLFLENVYLNYLSIIA